jgi:allophanate hydrolase subunit 2
VVLGPQDDFFEPDAIRTLLCAEYRVSSESDRMGYRLEGPQLVHARGYNIISDGVAAGSIQVPGARQPIALLMDRQPTGGYPKIATIVSADLAALAQTRPGSSVRFRAVTPEEAGESRREFVQRLAGIPTQLRPAPSAWGRRRRPLWQGV